MIPASHVHLDPLLANKLRTDFGITESGAGHYFLAFGGAALAIGLPLILVKEHIDKRGFILLGSLLAGLAQFLIGPSKLFGFPNEKGFVLAGLILSGAGYSLGYNFLYA